MSVQPRRRDGTNKVPSLVPRSARGKPTRAAPKIGADNVGFRMLKKAGWTEGTGLGKDREGPVEPLGAWAKADRKGVGHEAGAGHVVGDPDAKGGKPKAKAKDAIDVEVGPVMSKEQMAAHVAKERRDKGIAAYIGRLFKEEEPTADMNPLLETNGRDAGETRATTEACPRTTRCEACSERLKTVQNP